MVSTGALTVEGYGFLRRWRNRMAKPLFRINYLREEIPLERGRTGRARKVAEYDAIELLIGSIQIQLGIRTKLEEFPDA